MSHRSGASRRNRFDSVPTSMLVLDVGATAHQVRNVHSVLAADSGFTDGIIDLEVMVVMSDYFALGARDLLNKQFNISQAQEHWGLPPGELRSSGTFPLTGKIPFESFLPSI